jgi:hypothetical protein
MRRLHAKLLYRKPTSSESINRTMSRLSAILESDHEENPSIVSFVGARTLSPIVIRRFSPERNYVKEVDAKTVIPHLLTVDLWSSDPTTVINAFEELGHLCHPDGKDTVVNRKLVHDTGGHLAYSVIMKKWNFHGDIQFRGICAFGVASMNEDFCNAAVQVGALEAIIVAMKNFPDDEYIQLSGCGALVVLSARKQRNAEHLVLELGAPKVIITAIKAYPHNYNLQGIACELLLSLAEHRHLKGAIVKAGGLRTLGVVVETNTKLHHGEAEESPLHTLARKAMQHLLEG